MFMLSVYCHSVILKINSSVPREILRYCTFKFCRLGDGIIGFYPIASWVPSRPVFLLDIGGVTQLIRSRDPFGKK